MYAVAVKRSALKELRGLPPDARERVVSLIDALAENPHPAGVRKVVGAEGLYRVRVGPYRILYELDEPARRLVITAVRKREDAYRRL